ncbi:NADPH:quinone reductase [Thalassobacillus devorans]|uniref:NADPH:quinone reductase n=1 Tax=Thalassobacillus devorans TaxID=279813 RepID=A0ABQ1NR16_9BACI|nr:quinone oxidoreductase [Thalassobacillus devorans]NIK28816.1 NADPH2:quinone reductase [Thalassobacillus devorans]GGC83328.1 NADPH:quinone reductase [Thalassobacillus devorans]
MKAIQFKEFGGPEVLELIDMETPEPGEQEVLIKTIAIGVNYADTARREGQYVVETNLPYIPGSEVAGVIEKVGPGVQRYKEGDRVVTLVGNERATGYAEYTVADERGLIPIPDGVDENHAAAIPLQGLSAYHIIKTMGRLEKGETILIHAAAGGVGLFAIQLAKLFGAGKVIGTASSAEKRALAKEYGADEVVDYTKEGWEKEVRKLNDGRGVDVALEMAGGDIFHKTLDCLASFGRLVIYGVASGEEPHFYPSRLMAKNQTVTGFFLPQIMKKPDLFLDSLKEILAYIEAGQIKLEIGGVFSLEDAAEVHRKLQGRQTKGKLILKP